MRRVEASVILGLLLIAAGVVFLLQTLGIVEAAAAYFWGIAFGVAGLVFVYVFLTGPSTRWWAIIPGLTLLGLGAIILLDQIAPQVGKNWSGGIFLGAIALAFWVIYFLNRENWWAIIPGGILLTLAFVAVIGSISGIDAGWVFFLGLGLTFVAVAYLPGAKAHTKWALIPAIVLLVIGIVLAAASAEVLGYVWPVVLIVLGLYLVARVLGSAQKSQ